MTSTTNLSKLLEFMTTISRLKHIKRTGWVLKDVKNPETISGHMYRMSILSMLIPEDMDGYHINRNHCIKLSLVHDMAESIVGDITPNCGVTAEEKHRRENEAMKKIQDLVGGEIGQEFYDLWDEYENLKSQEAIVVKDLDKFDMILQAYEYEKEDLRPNALQEFFDSTKGKFTHPEVKKWVNELNETRAACQSSSSS